MTAFDWINPSNRDKIIGISGQIGRKDGRLGPLGEDPAYNTLPSSAITNVVKRFMNSPTRLESQKSGQISSEEHYYTGDLTITYKGKDEQCTLSIDQFREYFSKRVQNGAKIFNFLLQKLNEQNYEENTAFQLSDLVDAGIYANKDSAYKGLKNVLDKLMHVHIEGKIKFYEGRKRKEAFNTKTVLVASRTISYTQCIVTLPPIIRNFSRYIAILPQWAYSLQSENAYMLIDYIYYLARQNTEKIAKQGCFNIGLDTVRAHLGLPAPDNIRNSRYSQQIIEPIERAVTDIEDRQEGSEIKITPVYKADYKNIHEYLDGYLEIRLSGQAFTYMKQLAVKKEKKAKQPEAK